MSNTLKLGNGQWATGKDTLLAYNDLNSNYKPLAFSFSRDTSATVVNKDGLIEKVGSGEPRIDFKDNTKGALLLEPQRTNLITYSQDFSNYVWNTGSTRSVNFAPTSTIDPQGKTNAYRVTSTASDNQVAVIGSIVSGQIYTNSIYVRRVSGNGNVALRNVNNEENIFEVSVNDGWKRIETTATSTSTFGRLYINLYTVGDVIEIWGGQLEQGSYATSYIPTSGQSGGVTRVVDNITQTTPNLSNSQEVTAFIDLGARPLTGINTTSNNFRLDFGTGNTRIIYNQNSSSNHRIELNINGSATYYTLSNLLTTTRAKIGISLTPTTLVIYANGVEYHSVSIASADWSNLLEIETAITDAIGNIKINDFKFYNTALTNQELIALTTI